MDGRKPDMRILEEAAKLIERLEDAYGEDYTVGTIVIAVDVGITGPADEFLNPVHVQASDPRAMVRAALLAEALHDVEAEGEAQRERALEIEDDGTDS